MPLALIRLLAIGCLISPEDPHATLQPAYAMHPDYNAIIMCEQPVIDVGTIWVGPDVKARFPITNVGTETAWIQVWSSGGACGVVIEPGDTVFVAQSLRSPKLHGSFAKSITVRVIDEPTLAVPACFGTAGHSDWCIRYSAD